MKKGFFITGTNTNIGKTFVSTLLMLEGLAQGLDIRYFKPVQTGDDEDCITIKKLVEISDDRIIQPVYKFKMPAAPYIAAKAENQEIKLENIIDYWQTMTSGFYLVEGAGGLLVPLAENILLRELIKQLKLPLIIVASTELGTINHTLLTIEAAKTANIDIYGVVLNGVADKYLVDIIEKFANVPVIAHVNPIHNFAKENLQKTAKKIFYKSFDRI